MCKYIISAFLVLLVFESSQACSIRQGPPPAGYTEEKAIERYVQKSRNQKFSVFVAISAHISALDWDKTGLPALGNAKLVTFDVKMGWGPLVEEQTQLSFANLCPPRQEPISKGHNYLVFSANGRIDRIIDLEKAGVYLEKLGGFRYSYIRGRLKVAHNLSFKRTSVPLAA